MLTNFSFCLEPKIYPLKDWARSNMDCSELGHVICDRLNCSIQVKPASLRHKLS